MYVPPLFAETRPEILHDLIRTYPLAALLSTQSGQIECSHIPMVLDVAANCLRGHVARANSHWRQLADAPVLVIFQGPQHYITPNWYASKEEHGKVVPTWNYAVVHVHGRARVREEAPFILRNVTELTDHNEARFPQPWRVADAPAEYVEGLTRAIVGLEISIERIEGKWKLSQNREAQDRAGVMEGLESLATGESLAMAALMKSRER